MATAAANDKREIKVIPLIACAIILVAAYLTPPFKGLSIEGTRCFFLLAIAIIVMLTQCLPLGIAGFMLFLLQIFLQIQDFGKAFSIFSMPNSWFLFVSLGLSGIIGMTTIPDRVLAFGLRVCGSKTKNLILGIMLGTMLISSVISNIPATALPAAFALVLIKSIDDPKQKAAMAKALMIGIPFAAMMGGNITPAGSHVNVIVLDLMKLYLNSTIGWGQWTLINLPVAIVMTIACWAIVMAVFKPPEIPEETRKAFIEKAMALPPLSSADLCFIFTMSGMLILWILGSWFPFLNTTVVALLGLCVMAMPKIGIKPMQDIMKAFPFAGWLMGTGFGSIAIAINTLGSVKWLMQFVKIPDIGAFWFMVAVGVVMALLHLPIPTGPSLLNLCIGPFLTIASGIGGGLHPAYTIFALTYGAAFNMILPLDSVPIVTYAEGYYTFADYMKAGIPATIVGILLTSAWITFIVPVLF